ncbi:unnamed protein product [Auanema sp. JU1783]|nr:unnamed protein product [Auanema sp. JU1783]
MMIIRQTIFHCLALFHFCKSDDSYNNIFRMGAVLNAAGFNKHLQNEFYRQLYVSKITKLLSIDGTTSTLHYNSDILSHFAQILDDQFMNISTSVHSLDSSLSRQSLSAPSCNSVLDALRITLNPIYSHHLFRRQFAFTNDYQFEYPSEFLPTHAKLHWSAILKERLKNSTRNVVLLLDIGSISLDSQLETLKTTSLHLLDVALPNDFYAILVIDSNSVLEICSRDRHPLAHQAFIPINSRNIKKLQSTVEEIRRNAVVNSSSSHSFALEKSFELLSSQKNVGTSTNIIQYISRGKLEELSDASNVLKSLAVTVLKYKFAVKINTLIITDGTGSSLLWPAEFMESIAKQNFSRYRYSLNLTLEKQLEESQYKPFVGEAVLLNRPLPLSLSLNAIENLLKPDGFITTANEASWHIQPKAYGEDEEQIATVTQTISDDRGLTVFGIDVPIHDLFWPVAHDDHVLYAPPSVDFEVFLTIEKGYIVSSSSGHFGIYINEVDDWAVSSKWLLDDVNAEQGDIEISNRSNKKLFYYWKKLKTKPFLLFIRTTEKSFPFSSHKPNLEIDKQLNSQNHLIYNHRSRTGTLLCVQNGEWFNYDFSTLFLPISIYPFGKEPFHRSNYLYTSEVHDFDEKELSSIIQQEMHLLSLVSRFWKSDMTDKDIPVIRRFLASRRGVLVVSPATRISNRYEPLRQRWFQEAMKNEGKLVATGPYLKAHLGEVIVLSMTVSFAKNESVFGVLGLEIPTAYFRLLLAESLSLCSQSRRCVIFTASGSIIYAGEESEKARISSDVLERFHISHQEPMLTSQMIRDPALVHRARCKSSIGVRRYFEWQTQYKKVHTSPCGSKPIDSHVIPIQHEIVALSNTNLFIAMINTTCNRSSATVFCPCSVNDHRCLICGRYSEHECECPCQCSINELCALPAEIEEAIPFCPIALREDRLSIEVTSSDNSLNMCEHTSCSSLLHITTCLATVGCGWCEFDSKGNRLPIGNCMPISVCYQGVHGRTTMKAMDRLEQWALATPFGPFAAGILTIFLVVALLFYCYRAQVSGITTRRSFSDGAPLFNGHTNFDGEYDRTVFKEEKQCVQLASFEREAPPPQNPNRNVDSDHGYSTMTDRNTINEETESSTSYSTDRPRLSIKVLTRDKPGPTYITTAAIIHPEPRGSLLA